MGKEQAGKVEFGPCSCTISFREMEDVEPRRFRNTWEPIQLGFPYSRGLLSTAFLKTLAGGPSLNLGADSSLISGIREDPGLRLPPLSDFLPISVLEALGHLNTGWLWA